MTSALLLAISSMFSITYGRLSVPVTQKVLILDENLSVSNCTTDEKPDCLTACMKPVAELRGMEFVACSDSDQVNTYVCSYQGLKDYDGRRDCNSCLTDDETGLFFERKTLIPGRGSEMCKSTCEYTFEEYGDEGECVSLCPKRNRDLALTHCTLDQDFLVCEYEGMSRFLCSSCPDDDQIEEWNTSNQLSIESGPYCMQTCSYEK